MKTFALVTLLLGLLSTAATAQDPYMNPNARPISKTERAKFERSIAEARVVAVVGIFLRGDKVFYEFLDVLKGTNEGPKIGEIRPLSTSTKNPLIGKQVLMLLQDYPSEQSNKSFITIQNGMIQHLGYSLEQVSILAGSLKTPVLTPQLQAKIPVEKFGFEGVEYLHRSSSAYRHSYTPAHQEEIKHASDIISITYYPAVTKEAELKELLDEELKTYELRKAKVLANETKAKTADRPASYLYSAALDRPQFFSVEYKCFEMLEGVGVSISYTHQVKGPEAAAAAKAWQKQNKEQVKKTLTQLEAVPLTKGS